MSGSPLPSCLSPRRNWDGKVTRKSPASLGGHKWVAALARRQACLRLLYELGEFSAAVRRKSKVSLVFGIFVLGVVGAFGPLRR